MSQRNTYFLQNIFSARKHLLPFLFFTIVPFAVKSNPLPPFIEWQKCFGWTDYYGDEGVKVISTSNNQLAIIGKRTNIGVEQIWFAKTDLKGNIVSELYVFDDDSYSGFRPTDIIQDTNGDFIITGRVTNLDRLYFADYNGKTQVSISNYHQNYDYFIMKISQSGTLLWQKIYGGLGEDIPMKVVQKGTNYFVFGNSFSTDGDLTNSGKNITTWNKDVFIIKIDNNGNLLSKKCIGGTDDDTVLDVKKTADNNFILVGNSKSNDGIFVSNKGEKDVFVTKIDENFNVLWSKTLGGTNTEEAVGVIQLPNAEYVLAVNSNSLNNDFYLAQNSVFPDNFNENIWLIRLSEIGWVLQSQILGGTNKDFVNDIQLSADKKILLTGTTNSNNGNIIDRNRIPANNNGSYDALIMKLNTALAVEWERTVGGSADDLGASLKEYGDGNLLVLGTTKSTDGDVWRLFQPTDDRRDIWFVNLIEPCETVLNLNQQITNENRTQKAKNTINTTDVIQNQSSVIYRAGKQINLSSGFQIEAGSVANFNIVPCQDTVTALNQNPIQIKINNECREGGMKFVFRPISPDTISANYKVSIQNLTPVIPLSFSGKTLIERNNSPYQGLPAFYIVSVSREGYQDLMYQGYTGTCEHDGAPINCPENTHDLILNKEYYQVGEEVIANWTGGLLSGQNMQWFVENINVIYQDNTTFRGTIMNFPVKIQAQPSVDPNNRTCHGGVYALLRKKLF